MPTQFFSNTTLLFLLSSFVEPDIFSDLPRVTPDLRISEVLIELNLVSKDTGGKASRGRSAGYLNGRFHLLEIVTNEDSSHSLVRFGIRGIHVYVYALCIGQREDGAMI